MKLIDIARIAKVSESAVSRALHDNPRISEATRHRIKKIAADLEFDFNSHARSLSTSKSNTVGVIVPNFGNEASNSYYLDLLINDIRSNLAANGYDMLIADSSAINSRQSNLRRLALQKKVDGLVLIIAELAEADRQVLIKNDIPVVLVNSKPMPMADQSLDGFPYFFTDNLAGGRLAAHHLISQGCRRLLCMADSLTIPEMVDRSQGFMAEARRQGLDPLMRTVSSHFAAAHDFVAANRAVFRADDGVFCHTDLMACAILRGLQASGFRVPQELRIMGFDDIELGTYFSPPITTIHQPREAIASQACAHLIRPLTHGDAGQSPHVYGEPAWLVRE